VNSHFYHHLAESSLLHCQREASYPLLLYLGHNDWNFDPPFVNEALQSTVTILELGAGTGIVTSRIIETVATSKQDIVISTDLPEVCPLLEANLKETLIHPGRYHQAVHVRPLAWGNSRHAIEIGKELGLVVSVANSREPRYLTHIVCSDLVCGPHADCSPRLLTFGVNLTTGVLPRTAGAFIADSDTTLLSTIYSFAGICDLRAWSNYRHVVQDP
jgi:hypothetical protein